MGRWTHPVCDKCYSELEPGREPHRLIDRELELCCRCGAATTGGIYYRQHPEHFLCKGRHKQEAP